MKKNIGLVVVLVVIFLAGITVFARMNNASEDTVLPAEEMHEEQRGISVEQHEFTPLK